MKEKEVFAHLAKQKKSVLLGYLRLAFEEMDDGQRQNVFADTVRSPRKAAVDGDRLAEELGKFQRDSLARKYYEPFMINSKNFTHVPAKTHEWCQRFAGFVQDAMELTQKGKHAPAVRCFTILWELMSAFESGEEIIFAEEAGSWMIPADEKAWLKAYLTSLADTVDPDGFTAAAVPIIERDSWHSFADQVYASALMVANPEQKARLQAEIEGRKIRIGPTAR